MKKLSLALTTLALITLPTLASAQIFYYYTSIDFSNDRQQTVLQNMMADEIQIPDDADDLQFGIKFILAPGETYSIVAAPGTETSPEIQCTYSQAIETPLDKTRTLVQIHVFPGVDTDDGSSCNYTITRGDGRAVTVNYYSEGT